MKLVDVAPLEKRFKRWIEENRARNECAAEVEAIECCLAELEDAPTITITTEKNPSGIKEAENDT